MKNIKIIFRKFHLVLGIIFVLPLLWSSLTAVLFVIADEFLHNSGLADYIIKFHTLEIIGLEDVYPFVVLVGVVGLAVTGIVMALRKKRVPDNR